ncbi:MAG TPA: bifunctional isocitrate dehydrogenase kinase/phosphatase [Candidatus Eisenbacteria bacterium]|nr:bifunctional isocitrate dehydrogenase kinase/phosphatase [Candidatus Eisenbacteria bacterium]
MERQRDPSDRAALAATGAELIADGFERYLTRFRALTAEARGNFERSDWPAIQRGAKNRLDLYGGFVVQSVAAIRELLDERSGERETWTAIRSVFERRIALHPERELAETFFNSNVRRVFHTVGVDPLVEFVRAETFPARYAAPWSFTSVHRVDGSLEAAIRAVLLDAEFTIPWDDLEGDAARVAASLAAQVPPADVVAIEMVRAPFFRGKGAYLAGQIHTRGGRLPLLLALRNPAGAILLDAALFSEDELSVVFSFAHTYFFVELERVKEMVDFLGSLLPRKPIADLWSALGFHRHAKTELYRSLLHHLATSDERFDIAVGQRGLVMVVFALPGFDVVFKVIRDRFPPPKTVTHEEVREKYRLVFRHDRAGRLVDAQEFEHLEFPRERFTPALLEELATSASESVEIRESTVVLRHLYTERRLVPLDVFLQDAPAAEARAAVLEYGQVMRDLAATNIFPGDMLLKNFGVSRHGRVIFYDYDELCLLTDCRFRELPSATTDEEEVALEPWYFVGEDDIFPEEFRAFLGLRGDLLESFLATHRELLEPAFWRRMQELHRQGVVPDIYPYPASRRLRPEDARWDAY